MGATSTGADTNASVTAGAASIAATPAVSSLITSVPCFTLSPVEMYTSLTVPAWLEGTSMVALSVSKVIKPSSCSITSPTDTSTSITSTSPSSPMSGTATSTIALAVVTADVVGVASGAGTSTTGTGVTGTGAAGATSEESAVALAPVALISPITSPSLILSPTFTDKLASSPAKGAGISIDALSVSTVTIPSSASSVSPTAKQISMISTSSPPTSGTRIF